MKAAQSVAMRAFLQGHNANIGRLRIREVGWTVQMLYEGDLVAQKDSPTGKITITAPVSWANTPEKHDLILRLADEL